MKRRNGLPGVHHHEPQELRSHWLRSPPDELWCTHLWAKGFHSFSRGARMIFNIAIACAELYV